MLPNFNYSQELARRDGKVQVVNLHATFSPDKKDVHTKGNPYKHLDTMAHDFAGPGTTMHKFGDIATLVITGQQKLPAYFVEAVQS